MCRSWAVNKNGPASLAIFVCFDFSRRQEARCRRAWKIADRESYLLQQALYQQQQQQMQQQHQQQHQLHQLQLQLQQQLGGRGSGFSSASPLQGVGEYGSEPGAQQVRTPVF